MEANVCDVNHLDADVLLPPRKRLLAGLKKQNCDNNECSSHASTFASSSSSPSSVFNSRLNNLLTSHANKPDLSLEEIVENARTAAEAAAAAAKAARAATEEKAAIAARAVAAAKSALDLLASLSEEAGSRESFLKKNKLKKHVPVNSLYKKYKPVENCKTDEELARTLHRAINSSPRISKTPSTSGSKVHKNKKPRILTDEDKVVTFENGHSLGGDAGCEQSLGEKSALKLGEKTSKYAKSNQLELENGESSQSKEKMADDVCTTGKKRGRVKLKKLPLSICAIKDIATPKDEVSSRSFPVSEERTGSASTTLFAMEPSGDNLPSLDATSIWKGQEFKSHPCPKCQEFQAPACVKQNKVAQS